MVRCWWGVGESGALTVADPCFVFLTCFSAWPPGSSRGRLRISSRMLCHHAFGHCEVRGSAWDPHTDARREMFALPPLEEASSQPASRPSQGCRLQHRRRLKRDQDASIRASGSRHTWPPLSFPVSWISKSVLGEESLPRGFVTCSEGSLLAQPCLHLHTLLDICTVGRETVWIPPPPLEKVGLESKPLLLSRMRNGHMPCH